MHPAGSARPEVRSDQFHASAPPEAGAPRHSRILKSRCAAFSGLPMNRWATHLRSRRMCVIAKHRGLLPRCPAVSIAPPVGGQPDSEYFYTCTQLRGPSARAFRDQGVLATRAEYRGWTGARRPRAGCLRRRGLSAVVGPRQFLAKIIGQLIIVGSEVSAQGVTLGLRDALARAARSVVSTSCRHLECR